ncbi:hypothetical protein FIBSPDRAFT_967408, partial [Athelia psychrophila]
ARGVAAPAPAPAAPAVGLRRPVGAPAPGGARRVAASRSGEAQCRRLLAREARRHVACDVWRLGHKFEEVCAEERRERRAERLGARRGRAHRGRHYVCPFPPSLRLPAGRFAGAESEPDLSLHLPLSARDLLLSLLSPRFLPLAGDHHFPKLLGDEHPRERLRHAPQASTQRTHLPCTPRCERGTHAPILTYMARTRTCAASGAGGRATTRSAAARGTRAASDVFLVLLTVVAKRVVTPPSRMTCRASAKSMKSSDGTRCESETARVWALPRFIISSFSNELRRKLGQGFQEERVARHRVLAPSASASAEPEAAAREEEPAPAKAAPQLHQGQEQEQRPSQLVPILPGDIGPTCT